MSTIYIGSARIGENSKITGGADGDQKQKSSNGKADYAGEVSEQAYYLHSKNWVVYRPTEKSNKVGDEMIAACSNKNIGYNQDERYDVVSAVKAGKHLGEITKKVNSDCSALVRAVFISTYGFDPGDFSTANAGTKLTASGKFKKIGVISKDPSPIKLYKGDVLCTQTKGHIVVVTRADSQPSKSSASSVNGKKVTYYKACSDKYKSFVDALKSIGADSSMHNRKKIAKVNGIISYNGSSSDNQDLLKLLKRGKLIKSKG